MTKETKECPKCKKPMILLKSGTAWVCNTKKCHYVEELGN